MTPDREYRHGRVGLAARLRERRPTGRAVASDTSTSFHDYLGMLARRKWLAAGIFLAVIGLTVLSIVRTRPVYQARATFMVTDRDQSSILDNPLASLTGNSKQPIDNCIELLRSQSLAEKVAERMPDSSRPSAQDLQLMVNARPLRQTDVIELVASGKSKEVAITTANAYLDAYREYDLDQNRAEVSATRKFIEDQLAVVGPRLDTSERNLEQFKTTHQ